MRFDRLGEMINPSTSSRFPLAIGGVREVYDVACYQA